MSPQGQITQCSGKLQTLWAISQQASVSMLKVKFVTVQLEKDLKSRACLEGFHVESLSEKNMAG